MSKTPRVSFRMKKQKAADLVKVQNHNQRLTHDSKIVKPENTHLNECLFNKHGDLDIAAAVQKEVKDRVKGKKPVSHANVAIEVMLTASPEYFRDEGQERGEWNQQRMEAWRDANIEALKEKFGDNLVRVDLHLDESTPHMHAIVVPIQEKTLNKRRTKAQIKNGEPAETYTANRLSANEMMTEGGEYDPTECQDFFAEAVKDLGIKRGLKGSRATHSKLKELDRLMQEAADEAPTVPIRAKDPKRETIKGGFLEKDREEDDVSFYKRAYGLLKKWSTKQLGKANKLIRELSEALAVITKQLEQEKMRTEAYAQLVDDPEGLIELKLKLHEREEIVKHAEQRIDNRYANLKEREAELNKDHLVAELRKKNQSLTRENERLKQGLDVAY